MRTETFSQPLCWLHHSGEQALYLAWAQLSYPEGMRAEELALPFASAALSELTSAVLESSPRCGWGRTRRLTSSVTSQAQIQDFELAHTNTLYMLPECAKGADPTDPKQEYLHSTG